MDINQECKRKRPPDWKQIPTVVLVKIYFFLPLQQRLNASSTCKRWRQAVFSPHLWPTMSFDCSLKKQLLFRTQLFARTLRHTVLHLNCHSPSALRNGLRVLESLKSNDRIQSFALSPSHNNVCWTEDAPNNLLDKYVSAIETICLNAKNLTHFSLGCMEELIDHADTFLFLLANRPSHQRRRDWSSSASSNNFRDALDEKSETRQYLSLELQTLKSLHLASVKTNLEVYGLIDLQASLFQPFKNLQILSLDYDYLSNQLLQTLSSPGRSPLQRFHIHVHSYEEETPPILDRSWRNLVLTSPNLEVDLVILHSFEAIQNLLLILRPSLPLTHFKSFFCQWISVSAIDFMGKNFGATLKSIHIVDGFVEAMPMSYENPTQTEDPFVMLAWKCPKLESLRILGYEFLDENLVAIARLRGCGLKTLEVPQICILSLEHEEVEEEEELAEAPNFAEAEDGLPQIALMGVLGKVGNDFNLKVSESLEYPWSPMDDEHIPNCVWFPYFFDHSPESYYLPFLIESQAPPVIYKTQ